MREASRDKADIDALCHAVMSADSAKAAQEAITRATFDCIEFYDPREGD